MCKNTEGYTLIELIVVIILLGLIFSITAPQFRDAVLTDNLKSATRVLIGKINALRADAIQNQENCLLFFDLDENMYWYGFDNMTEEGRDSFREKNATYLPAGVRITDVSFTGKDKVIAGEAVIRFSKKGYAQQTAIHLESEDGREFTIMLRTFLPGVKVFEEYTDFEEL